MKNEVRVRLTKPQGDFVTAPELYPAMVAGYGSGKSHAAMMRAIKLKLEYPKLNVAYYMPTYDLIARAAFPRFVEILTNFQIPHKLNKNEAVISISGQGEIIFRTMDNPERIVAYEVADSILDELDTLPIQKAQEVWHKAMGRNRQKKPDGKPNTMAVATTPEGFRFVYERWKKNPAEGYRIIKASTTSNAVNLPDGYIDGLRNTYPSNLLAAYLDGEFVNLTADTIYSEFDRVLNATSETVKDNDDLHIGMDFNVGKMAACVYVLRNDNPYAVDEITDVMDTPAIIAVIKSRYPKHRIFVYPDASGNSRRSNNASESDITLLRQAGFTIMVNSRNPAVKDRVMSMNAMINKDGERRYFVNPDKCPFLVETLEKQAYDKNGEPDKTTGLDHMADAAGYMVVYRYPIAARPAIITNLVGL